MMKWMQLMKRLLLIALFFAQDFQHQDWLEVFHMEIHDEAPLGALLMNIRFRTYLKLWRDHILLSRVLHIG